MAHRKEEFESHGHDVTIQQVNEEGSPAAWIDGFKVSLKSAMDLFVEQSENPDDLQDKLSYHRENGETWKAVETLLSWMTDCKVYYCSNCDRFYDHKNVSRTGFAGHICQSCQDEKDHCPDNPDGNDHDDRCLNPSKRHRARVSTKYECKHCGRKRRTTPTG